ncbi:SDR family NAD(P)-dependent oxidoreductase [Thalassococcus lentus]|uniref:SDR family NAD(P)-dependent oxidoreductase n=1 Tax=Thalassococcus lentus TaxID=1210524 RepID=A0ABT4XU12_9RHOB|nr:SDR family NAD(P)-dependent oxidoreductase [Thalassococcus lentus]MDA7425459.1 SDR family NAD(P)-dependent oxidoreductase [Thalassococcus lentus]
MRVLITGANRGIGAEMARQMRDRGDEVIACSRGDADWPLDVTRQADFERLSDKLDGAAIDLVICNAGVYLEKGQSVEDGYAPALWDQTFAVNVTGVFLTAKTLLPNLRAAKAPKLAIISSQMGSNTKAPGGSYIYRASKAAALNLGRNLATDLAPQGIAVGIYHPGWVQTDMGGGAADITPVDAANGLISRFDHLSLDTTGCFETWDGEAHPL